MLLIEFTLSYFLFAAVTAAHISPAPRRFDRRGAVASEVDVCSEIGINLLNLGGSAADAAIGTSLCVGVTAMYHSGIGGGGFMIVRASNGSFEVVDFREIAPAAAYQDMYNNNTDASLYGGLASGVPGELRGLEYLHKRYGKLPWARLVEPSVRLAREGFRLSSDFISYMNSATPSTNFLTEDPSWAIDFAPNGTLLGQGDIMTRKRYANTLEAVARYGADAFYIGSIAKATIAALKQSSGIMTLGDLANYAATIRTPLEIEYRGYRLRTIPAPASGAVVLGALKVVEGYNMGSRQRLHLATHLLDESIRFGYGERTLLGDPAFVQGVNRYEESMINAQTASEVRSKISDFHTLNVSTYNPALIDSLETPGTAEIATADQSGMAVSITTTINTIFGSQIMVAETGVIMNNEMNDFSIPGISNNYGYAPSPANYIRPGKKPLSSMSPTIVERPDGTLYLVLGAGGGSRIITSNIQNLWHILDQNMTAPEALYQPRFHDQLIPNIITFEYAYDNSTVAYLRSLGHNVTWVAPGQAHCQAIRRLENGTFEAAGEPRMSNSGGLAT